MGKGVAKRVRFLPKGHARIQAFFERCMLYKMLSQGYEEDIKQISAGSTRHILFSALYECPC